MIFNGKVIEFILHHLFHKQWIFLRKLIQLC
ncbi:hypothetical protein EZ456_11885 [Pedobacter psychrodurus]|uniref:Uncharacterized protein n=1 Tax=Pedobacter psychrodurus TaxID=2530456 RepID=A0A4R0Q295_9SPHI|nr:hypothetical protein EZ456_11885 [Pedobacter psychrodurus]